ncbi:hypothetical protein [Nannocystis pusilla]|uniref:hypothetical protein n=1 Tax=Nannocystis pusilla TaxID=889268 RepID=UPI003B7BADE0
MKSASTRPSVSTAGLFESGSTGPAGPLTIRLSSIAWAAASPIGLSIMLYTACQPPPLNVISQNTCAGGSGPSWPSGSMP